MKIKVFTDGGSRGNPGPGGAGVVIYNELNNEIVFEKSKFLGIVTNNAAEYQALILALKWLLENFKVKKIEKISFFLDSKLVVEQMNKNWKIKHDNMKKLAQEAWSILEKINLPYSFQHLYREKNAIADSLVNQALDSQA